MVRYLDIHFLVASLMSPVASLVTTDRSSNVSVCLRISTMCFLSPGIVPLLYSVGNKTYLLHLASIEIGSSLIARIGIIGKHYCEIASEKQSVEWSPPTYTPICIRDLLNPPWIPTVTSDTPRTISQRVYELKPEILKKNLLSLEYGFDDLIRSQICKCHDS